MNFDRKMISKITLGTVQLGLNYGINNADGMPSAETAEKVLSQAIDCGITSFDTSSAYGTSEKVLGNYFNNLFQNIIFFPEQRVTCDSFAREWERSSIFPSASCASLVERLFNKKFKAISY